MLLFFFFLAILNSPLVAPSSTESWRSNCKALENNAVAPFLYLSQSDLAVLGFYSNIDYPRFKDGRELEIYFTPVCFVKGFYNGTFLKVVSGTQKCKITALSSYIEYPTLFFLKKDTNSKDKWLLLNSGEYQHRIHGKGILFGTGPGGADFPQTCGVMRQRTEYDRKKQCRDANCIKFCSYKVANSDNCVASSQILVRYLSSSDIPKAVPPFDNRDVMTGHTGGGNPSKYNSGGTGSTGGRRYSDKDGNSSGASVTSTKGSGGGAASSLSRPLSQLIAHLCVLSLVTLRYVT